MGDMLDHIKKLVMNLKHESISNKWYLTYQLQVCHEVEMLRACKQIRDKIKTRIIETKGGIENPQDHINMMDIKNTEIRINMNCTLFHTESTINNKDKEVRQLCANFSLLRDFFCGRKKCKKIYLN